MLRKNRILPSMLTDKLPNLKKVTSSQVIADHLYVVIIARKAFINPEAQDMPKRALARKATPAIRLIYATYDTVYYKRYQSNKAPSSVTSKNGH